MRLSFLALALALAACGKSDAQTSDDVHARVRPAQDDSEEARFARERHPDAIVAALGLHPGMTVADVGAGTGLLTVHLARAVAPNGKVVATDVDGAVLDMLASRVDAAGLGKVVERRVVPPDSPDLEPGAYDAILLAQVDHLFSDRVAWIKAAIPALKPGGRIVIENRAYNRGPAMDAAAKAGLHLESMTTDVPGAFIATFSVPQ